MVRHTPLITLLLLASCAAPAVNLPPLEGDYASHNPNHKAVSIIEAAALRHVFIKWPPRQTPVAYKLPEGTLPFAFAAVQQRLPEGLAMPLHDAPEGTPTYEVAQLYIRRAFARADIIQPTEDGRTQLVSVFLSPDLGGNWFAHRSKLWNIPAEEALRISRPKTPDAPLE